MAKKPFLQIGEVVSTHGVAGEMRVQPWCDSVEDFCTLETLYTDAAGTHAIAVHSRPHKNIALMKVADVTSVQAAAQWRGTILYAARADMALPAGRYFIEDLIGLPVKDADNGVAYGTVTAVSNTGASDIYHMRTPAGEEILIPAIPDIVVCVDLTADEIRIRPMEGLF